MQKLEFAKRKKILPPVDTNPHSNMNAAPQTVKNCDICKRKKLNLLQHYAKGSDNNTSGQQLTESQHFWTLLTSITYVTEALYLLAHTVRHYESCILYSGAHKLAIWQPKALSCYTVANTNSCFLWYNIDVFKYCPSVTVLRSSNTIFCTCIMYNNRGASHLYSSHINLWHVRNSQ